MTTKAPEAYLQTVTRKGDNFSVRYRSGATSTDHRVAQFFMAMADKGADVRDVGAYIAIGRHSDFETDWSEAKRILATFEKQKVSAP